MLCENYIAWKGNKNTFICLKTTIYFWKKSIVRGRRQDLCLKIYLILGNFVWAFGLGNPKETVDLVVDEDEDDELDEDFFFGFDDLSLPVIDFNFLATLKEKQRDKSPDFCTSEVLIVSL